MGRRLQPEDLRAWSQVAATVRPLPGRTAPKPPPESKPGAAAARAHVHVAPAKPGAVRRKGPLENIEPNRQRRIERGRAPLEATLDLHGYDQDRAEAAVRRFIFRAYDEGLRSILLITGRGMRGGGVLRQRTPEWLGAADLRAIIAGFSQAHQKHGGEGAIYVALKRKPHG